MFDIGFWELVIISAVALLVAGPERLPELVREAGRWLAALRRFIMQTKTEIERELDLNGALEKDLSTKIADLDTLARVAPDQEAPDKEKAPS